MNAPPKNLDKLVLLLSSDQPGEVFAAAQAIGRVLKTAGMDWHGLVAQMEGAHAGASTDDPMSLHYLMVRHVRELTDEIAFLKKHLARKVEEDEAYKRAHPRWGRLSRNERAAWCQMLAESLPLDRSDVLFLDMLRRRLWEQPHVGAEKGDAARFNHLMQSYEKTAASRERKSA